MNNTESPKSSSLPRPGRKASQILTVVPISVLTVLSALSVLSGMAATATGNMYNFHEFAAATHYGLYAWIGMIVAGACWAAFAVEFRRRTNGQATWVIVLVWYIVGILVDAVVVQPSDFQLLTNMDKWVQPFIDANGALLPFFSPWGGTIIDAAFVCVATAALYVIRTGSVSRPRVG